MKPGIEELISLGDYQRSYNWDLTFITVPNALKSLMASDQINVRCTSATLPTISTQVIKVDVRGPEIRIPGIAKYTDSIKLTLNETTDAYCRKFIEAWRKACWSAKEGKQTPYSDVTCTVRLEQLQGDHEVETTGAYKIYSCWMSSFDLPALSNSSSVWTPSITLVYNNYIVE